MNVRDKIGLAVWLRQFYVWAMRRSTYELGEHDLGQPAIVFSPHRDDETLGCGGTIIRKRREGVDVKIVFMTNGGASHSQLIDRDELQAIRAREAMAAGQILSVENRDVLLLGFMDGQLRESQDAAIDQVKEIL